MPFAAVVHAAFAISLVAALTLTFGREYLSGQKEASAAGPQETPAFKRFQRMYIGVYLLMMAGDWLQGPYMYALYDAYGFAHEDIAALFVAGFGSSAVFGTVAGSLADTMGRKKGALLYVVVYAASCVTKHWRSYNVLMFGRILGGVATSLLFSVFDSWLVAEHAARGFEPSWLSGTFANGQAGNSMVAVAAGVAGEWLAAQKPLTVLVEGDAAAPGPDGAILYGGYCAPFDAAIVVLLAGGLIILFTWPENYGERAAPGEGLKASLGRACAVIARDRRVLLLGGVTSCFEAAMYAFVFEWTPALTAPGAPKPPYGEIFAAMMICCAGGTRLFGFLADKREPQDFSRFLFALAALSMLAPVVLPGDRALALAAFLAFEAVVGSYFPVVGTLKSKIIPDAQRSTIYNLYRVPLNGLVLAVLLSKLPTASVFTAAATLLAIAAALQHALYDAMRGYHLDQDLNADQKSPLVSV